MKKMPKILSGALALALVACMDTTAFAAGPEANTEGNNITSLGNSETVDVQLQATLAEEEPTYSVNVKWESMAFVWTESSRSWSTANHEWSGDGAWNDTDGSKITVTNHSSENVKVGATYAPKTPGEYAADTPFNGVTVGFTGITDKVLNAGDGDNKDGVLDDNMAEATVTVSGRPEADIDPATVVGTVTVTVSTAD